MKVMVTVAAMTWPISGEGLPAVARLDSARRGDRAALGELIREHQQAVYTLACQMLRDPTQAEDVSQEAFIRLHRNIGTLERPEKVRSWLLRVTSNLCIDVFRRHKSGETVELDADPATGHLPDPAPLPFEQVAARERRQAVDLALADLPAVPRAILTLYYFEGMDCPEIGEVLDMPVNTVKSHLRRGRERLRVALDVVKEGLVP